MIQTPEFTEQELRFLRSHVHSVDWSNATVVLPHHQEPGAQRWRVELSNSEIEAALDELSSLFSAIGLQDTSYEPNQVGLFIEHLIDVLVRHKEW